MPDVTGVGPLLTLLGTFAGIWVVVILFRWFQRDFAATYRAELKTERARREEAERLVEVERAARMASQVETQRLRGVLWLHRIDPDPAQVESRPSLEG